ncbi:hypothetical protein pb186bvf_016710 [Paramecium bursaria]
MQFKDAPNNLDQLRSKEKVKFDETKIKQQTEDSQLQKQLKEIKKQLQEYQIMAANLAQQNDELLKENERKDKLIEKLNLKQSQEQLLKDQLRNKNEQVFKLEGEIADLIQYKDQLKQELYDCQKSKEIVYNIKNSVSPQQIQEEWEDEKRKLIKQLDQKKKAIFDQQAAKRNMKMEYENRIQQLELAVNQLQNEKEELYKQVNGFRKQQRMNAKENVENKTKVESLKQQITLLKRKPLEPEPLNYQMEIQDQRNKNLHLRQQLTQLEIDNAECQNQIALMVEKLKTADSNKHKIEQLSNELIMMETENEKLKMKNRTDILEMEQSREEFQQKEQELKDLKYELELKQFNLHNTIKYTQNVKDENEFYQDQIEQLKKQLYDLRLLYEKQQEEHENELRFNQEKLQIAQTLANQRKVQKIPIQVRSPYDIPNIEKHYL